MEQLGSHWTDFHKIWYLSNFQKSFDKIQVQLKSDKNKCYFDEDHYTFLIISRLFLLGIKNVSGKFAEKLEINFVYSITFVLKSCLLWDNMAKFCRARQATYDNMAHAHCMLDTQVHKYTHWGYCFSTVTTAARKNLNVTLYVNCLSCYW
jgi:hypothetical protein